LLHNRFGTRGERAFAEAVAANVNSKLRALVGVPLCEYLDVLDVSNEFRHASNDALLEHVQQRHTVERVKSARGGGVR
jgi:hypothetical protein